MTQFNIFAQLKKELQDFDENKVQLASSATSGKFLSRKQTHYNFSQRETLNLIDLYDNSQFEKGDFDSEGQRKVFLNIGTFRRKVASKQIQLSSKNFIFIPEQGESKWPAYFLSKDFRIWARQNGFAELLNESEDYLPKYGTFVAKKVGKKLERVPLKTLRNQQDAKDLATARYVIEVHEDMTLDDIKAMKVWNYDDLEDMKFGETTTVYERYARIPVSYYDEYYGRKGDYNSNETVDCLVVCTLESHKDQKEAGGTILFLEKITERPYLEVHWDKHDGRWLGVGEMENQFGNQVATNMIENLRKRTLLWSSKKIFQSIDDQIARNLVRDVKDGDVLKINPNGNITQVDMTTHSLAEFNAASDVYSKNSDQMSFTYEVATGEALPSGTPYRLGVILDTAVQSHFKKKQEKLGLFWEKALVSFIVPDFKKKLTNEHIVTLLGGDEGIEDLKQMKIDYEVYTEAKKQLLAGTIPDLTSLRASVEQQVGNMKELFVKIVENYYEDIEVKVQWTVTGEEIDSKAQIETLTNLYTTMVQSGDPRASVILERIVALTGNNSNLVSKISKPIQQGIPSPLPVPNQQPQP